MKTNGEIPLSEKDIIRMNEVRKSVWKGGIKGLVIGSALGAAGSYCCKYSFKMKKYSTKKYFLPSTLIMGSFMSFLYATIAGKNSVQYVGDIFRTNSNPISSYMKTLHENERQTIESMDESFDRRKEYIENTKNKFTKS